MKVTGDLCTKQHLKILMILFGMTLAALAGLITLSKPALETVTKLESFGVTVEIMGCIPPYVGGKTYLFECKNCKREWGEYGETEENL